MCDSSKNPLIFKIRYNIITQAFFNSTTLELSKKSLTVIYEKNTVDRVWWTFDSFLTSYRTRGLKKLREKKQDGVKPPGNMNRKNSARRDLRTSVVSEDTCAELVGNSSATEQDEFGFE